MCPGRPGRCIVSNMTHEHASHRSAHLESAPTDKVSWRRAIRAARRAMGEAERAELADRLSEQVTRALGDRNLPPARPDGSARKVAAYFSSPDEPDTSILLGQLTQRGYEVYLPVCEPRYQMSWTRWDEGTELVPSRVAPVMEPVGERHGAELFDQVELMLIPALAVDSAGMRLGQGGGYYDRFLPRLDGRGTRIAAIVYDDEFVEAGSFHVNSYDRPVGLVITPGARNELDNGF